MRPFLRLRLPSHLPPTPLFQTRFLSLPPLPTTPPPQLLTSSSTLPYPRSQLFQLIANINAYPTFLPYVTGARTTAWSGPDALYGKRWPRRAELRVGWWGGVVDERFESRVYCVPDRVVEAVSGRGVGCGVARGELGHYFLGGEEGEDGDGNGEEGGVFERMRTRWELEEIGGGVETRVRLEVDVRFASPVYAALSQAAGPRVTEIMVGAFERRAREVLGEGGLGSREKGEG